MQSRPFTWNDVPSVHSLMARWRAALAPRAWMHIGDMYWALRSADGDPTADAWVWERGDGSLAAFAWLDAPYHDDVAVDPAGDTPSLDDALTWLEVQAHERGRSSIGVVVIDGDVAREETLGARGYVRGGDGNTRLWRRIDKAPSSADVPDGYALRHVEAAEDFERRVFVEMDAFGGSGLTTATWRMLAERLPTYVPELDLIAVAPDGSGASAATLWYDAATRCGEVEAVGTAKAHLRRGLSKAVTIEGLRRLHALAATTAVVQTTIGNDAAIALYRSCGFEVVGHDYAWVKAL